MAYYNNPRMATARLVMALEKLPDEGFDRRDFMKAIDRGVNINTARILFGRACRRGLIEPIEQRTHWRRFRKTSIYFQLAKTVCYGDEILNDGLFATLALAARFEGKLTTTSLMQVLGLKQSGSALLRMKKLADLGLLVKHRVSFGEGSVGGWYYRFSITELGAKYLRPRHEVIAEMKQEELQEKQQKIDLAQERSALLKYALARQPRVAWMILSNDLILARLGLRSIAEIDQFKD